MRRADIAGSPLIVPATNGACKPSDATRVRRSFASAFAIVVARRGVRHQLVRQPLQSLGQRLTLFGRPFGEDFREVLAAGNDQLREHRTPRIRQSPLESTVYGVFTDQAALLQILERRPQAVCVGTVEARLNFDVESWILVDSNEEPRSGRRQVESGTCHHALDVAAA